MVVQRTLTPPVGVRSSHPQPFRSRSTLLRFFITGCSAVGSALGSGPRGRGFESRHSDQKDVCTVSRYKRLFCLGVPRIRTARPRRSGAQISPVGCLRGRGRIPSPDRRSLYRIPVQTAFLSWSAEDSNSPSGCRKTFFDFMQHLQPIEWFVGNGLDRSVLPCQKHDTARKPRAIRRGFMRCARPNVRMGQDLSLQIFRQVAFSAN